MMNLIDFQHTIKKFTKEKGIDCTVNVRMIDLASEVGELSKEVLKGTDYGKNDFCLTEEWESELGDVLFSLICIANETNTDLEQCLKSVLHKYERRFADKGNIGSGE